MGLKAIHQPKFECAIMITARSLVEYNSFWQRKTPMMERWVRDLNFSLYGRFDFPIEGSTKPWRRALVNEVAFDIVRFVLEKEILTSDAFPSDREVQALAQNARRRFSAFQGASHKGVIAGLRQTERQEARLLAIRIQRFFKEYEPTQPILLDPPFAGCGFIEESYGDVLAGTTLYELKAGDRSYRSVDIRQVLTYCALNHASRKFVIENIGLLNPRMGTFAKIEVDEIANSVSGLSHAELFDEIIHFTSESGVSK